MESLKKKLFFHELTKEAKECARTAYRDIMSDNFNIETDIINERFERLLMDNGFDLDNKDNAIEWDLSNSQGDYVGIDGIIKKNKLHELILDQLGEKEKRYYKELAIDHEYISINHSIEYNHHYGHHLYLEVDLDVYDDASIFCSFALEIRRIAKKEILNYVNFLTKLLKNEGHYLMEYFYSDTYIDKVLSNYDFNESGDFV